ncbi:MAG TPA: TRAP transporter small permease, partial [Alphaproteobacteria bacterium]
MDRAFELAARFFGLAAAVFLIAMMMISVADVSLRAAFDVPIFGTFDLVELFLVASVFLAIP